MGRAMWKAAAVRQMSIWARELHGRIFRGKGQLGCVDCIRRGGVPAIAIRRPRQVIGETKCGCAVEEGRSRGRRARFSRVRLSGVRLAAGRGLVRVGIQRGEDEAAACRRRRGALVTHGDDRRGVRVRGSTRLACLVWLGWRAGLVLVRLALPVVGERRRHGQDDGRVRVGCCCAVVSVKQEMVGRREKLLVRLHKASPAAGASAAAGAVAAAATTTRTAEMRIRGRPWVRRLGRIRVQGWRGGPGRGRACAGMPHGAGCVHWIVGRRRRVV